MDAKKRPWDTKPFPEGALLGGKGQVFVGPAPEEERSLISTLAFPAPQLEYHFYKTGGLGRVDLQQGRRIPALLTREDLVYLRTSAGLLPASPSRSPWDHRGEGSTSLPST